MKLIDDEYMYNTLVIHIWNVKYIDFVIRAFNTFVIKAIMDQIKQNKKQDLKFIKFRKQNDKIVESIPSFAFRIGKIQIYINFQIGFLLLRALLFPYNVNVWYKRHKKTAKKLMQEINKK